MSDNEAFADVGSDQGDPDLGYDAEAMEGVGSEEDFNHAPGWKRLRLSKMTKKMRAAEDRAAVAEGEKRQLENRLAALEQRVVENGHKDEKPAPEGWDAFDTGSLRKYITDGNAALQAALANPENDELRQAALAVDPNQLQAVNDELSKRTAREAVNGLRTELTDGQAKQQAALKLQQKMVRDFGNDVLDPQSPLMQSAATIFGDLQRDFGAKDDPNGTLTYMALQQAHEKQNPSRGGRGLSEADRRRLAVEAQTRREAGISNSIAALKQKGDWKSRAKAVDLELDEFVKRVAGGR